LTEKERKREETQGKDYFFEKNELPSKIKKIKMSWVRTAVPGDLVPVIFYRQKPFVA
jgi:hypothetical protein